MKAKILFLFAMLLTVFSAEAKFLFGDYGIKVTKPGDFYEKYKYSSYFKDTDSITITGPMNEADLRLLGKLVCPAIFYLDLSGAQIVDRTIPADAFNTKEIGQMNYCNLVSIKLPDDLKVIENSAFKSIHTLEEINMPASLERVGAHSFENCYSLRKITFDKSICEIGDSAFANTGIEQINLPEGLQSIGVHAFLNTRLKKVAIPESCTDLAPYAFEFNLFVEEVKLPSSIDYIPEGLFHTCPSIAKLEIPKGVSGVHPFAFYGCSSLVELKLPSTLSLLSMYAFFGNKLETVYLPENVSSLYAGALYGQNPVKCLYVKAKTPFIFNLVIGAYGTDFFPIHVSDENVPIYVPKQYLDDFKTAITWEQFTNYIGIEDYEFPSMGVNAVGADNKINIYSSASGEVVIEGYAGPYSLFDMQGALVGSGRANGSVRMKLSSGLYIVTAGKTVKKIKI